MTFTTEKLKQVISEMKGRGIEVGLRDISFSILRPMFDNPDLPYRAIFGDVKPLSKEYLESPKIIALQEMMTAILNQEKAKDAKLEEMRVATSFDELKQGLIDDMAALEELRDSRNEDGAPVLDAKEMAAVVGRIADIRSKLVDKFSVSEQVTEQRVVVEQKFNSICPFCHREIAIDPNAKLLDL